MQPSFFNPWAMEPCIPPLRDYQDNALDELRDGFRKQIQSQMLCLPTGGGKSLIGGELCRAALARESRTWFIADREILVEQLSDELGKFGLPHGIIMSDASRDRYLPLQVCSAQTLTVRTNMPLPKLAVVDEAHTVHRALMRRMLKGGVRIVGLSATPFTRSLGRYYKRVVSVRSTNKLIEEGWLAPLRVLVPPHVVDNRLMDVNKAGEYTEASAARAAMRITGDIVADWPKACMEHFGRTVKTLVFAASIAHAEHLAAAFADAGYDFRLYIQNTPKDERKRALAALQAGKIDGLISVDALSRGFDQPDIECVIMARAFKRSLAQVIQMLGRGMRIATGKRFCLILDHAGNFSRMWTDIFDFWERGAPERLDMGARRVTEVKDRTRREIECHECGFVRPPGNKLCPNCGAQPAARDLNVESVPGSLEEFDPAAFEAGAASRKSREEIDAEAMEKPWPHICAMALQRLRAGLYKSKPDPYQAAVSWARVQYKELRGHWPPRTWDKLAPGENTSPNPAVEKAVRDRLEAWKKTQDAEPAPEPPGITLFPPPAQEKAA